jgi:UDP-N-acetylglucosamine 2-epimerase (non-hydrolysing)
MSSSENNMIKVLTVLGTRPEAIKMAPIIKQLQAQCDIFLSQVCVTAQHRQMLDQVLGLFQIEPTYDLDIMQTGQSPTQVAAIVLSQLESILAIERPDWMLVQGDTTTVAAASWAAAYAQVKIGHVEAGLRTYNKLQPFPEEINRRIVSVMADLHFAPTQHARQCLLNEGISPAEILVTGNSVIDALQMAVRQPYNSADCSLLRFISWEKRLILVTAHRRENFGRPLEQICHALRDVAELYSGEVEIIYPVHPNPQVWGPVHRLLDNIPGITLTEPLGYLPFIHLMNRSTIVLTDSGGVQEEAHGLGKPVLVLRNVTERPEAIEAGTARLAGITREQIVGHIRQLLDDPSEYARMARAINPYGDGHAAERIVNALIP